MTVSRRKFIYTGGLLGAAAALNTLPLVSLTASTGTGVSGPAAALYQRSLVIDGLGGPDGMGDKQGQPLSEATLQAVRDCDMSAFHMTLGNVGSEPPLQAFAAIMHSIAHWNRLAEQQPELFRTVYRVEDIQQAHDSGQAGLIYGLQDGVAFEDDLDRMDTLQQLGIRVIQPTYNRRNLLGDGCMEPADAGLSRDGRKAIEKMNELGITVDLSHCGRRTTADAFEVSTRPVSFTHTGCHALVEHPRHRTDSEMKAAADSGGVVGIYIMPYLAQGKQPQARHVLDHLEHAIKVAGEDHVSIGTDGGLPAVELTEEYRQRFAEITRSRKRQGIAAPFETEEGYLFASDLNTPRRFETLAEQLLQRGHSETRIEKILGSNLVRLFKETWT